MAAPATSYARLENWLPRNHNFITDWLAELNDEIDQVEDDGFDVVFHPCIEKFEKLIEGDAVLRMLASAMFTEVPNKRPYLRDPTAHRQVHDYHHMLVLFNRILTKAPEWTTRAYGIGLVGFPFNAIIDWPMATPSGYAFFLNKQVNMHLKEILTVWKNFLHTEASADVVSSNNWLSPEAKGFLTDDANLTPGKTYTFEELYVCDPSKPHYGWKSWDDFFIRLFRPGIRPIAYPDDKKFRGLDPTSVVVNACESKPYALKKNVKEYDRFWLKGQEYSLYEIFSPSPLAHFAPSFVGGTVYQAFLSPTTYHRWHAPVSGTVLATTVIDGTYYSEPTFTGFAQTSTPDPASPDFCQGYLAQVATRAILVIKADNKDLGLVCFVPIGMAEVSSCEFGKDIVPGAHITKGQETGMFHHGGSTYCLIFQGHVKLDWVKGALPGGAEDRKNQPLNSALAFVR
ncbi:hypothetical protein ASPWEDRAFT_41398 [Aspergillus wentii DTO 134E9]|uniref:L-tryptophan decarboxylase PsiD-like domain-containing protein n=1 Tax=Aspergillus wentii DTO 134E9 TaxID=1073089 RepID=A0A1L9RML5_ASPWE|nr:uncharacterized protein ASPWEDRAFT_41398 [Aspergillus wentii DTO 134E9]KAI9929386.1 hypothetical protein MW887_000855 [Aspergillus wentii]OJJ36171.1 hypothetical protein ASPWEDRAFT_41398 [Aspergillus wentii DTO 134E9]